jgi:hypothetical protein
MENYRHSFWPRLVIALALFGICTWTGKAWFHAAPPEPKSLRAPDLGSPWQSSPSNLDVEGDQLVAALGLSQDPKGVLFYLQNLNTVPSDEKLAAAISDFESDDFPVRQGAEKILHSGGLPGLALLEKAAKSEDLEVARRANECAATIRRSRSPALIGALARMLVREKEAGGVEALMGMGGQLGVDESPLFDALAKHLAIFYAEGMGESVLAGALADKAAHRRALGAATLGATPEWADRVLPILDDNNSRTRLYAAWALVRGGRREGMPKLLEGLADAPPVLREEVVEHLYQVAGDSAPDAPWGPSPEERQAFGATWLGWWAEAGPGLGSITLGPRPFLDRTLLVYLDAGEVAALDSNDRDVWRIRKVDFPLDAEPLQGNRVLLAENQGGRVCIRSHTGRILWQYAVESPIVAQALPGGKTFIATRSDLFVIDRLGNRVREWKRPRGEVIMRASALPDGGLALINMRQRFMRLDAAGEVVESFPVMVSTTGGRVDVAPDGRVLIPMMHQDLVLEMDGAGQEVRRFRVAEPIIAQRLANGHVMITSMSEQKAMEYDAAGRVVWEYQSRTSRVTRAIRH